MTKERIKLEVYVDLDPVPGTFHNKESAVRVIAYLLDNQLPHYRPVVKTTDYWYIVD